MIDQLVHTRLGGTLRVRRLRGRGAQGEVYDTSDAALLLKVCSPDQVDGPKELAQFRQDSRKRYQTFAELRFGADQEVSCLPLEYLDVEYDGLTPAYLMRPADGRTMNRNLAAINDLPIRDRCRIGWSLGHAIGLLHTRGVVHADFKPDNFFFSDDGAVQVLDVDGGGYSGGGNGQATFWPNVTATFYLAPELVTRSWKAIWSSPARTEVARRRRRIQPDLWSLAVLMYQILVDRAGPFPIPDPKEDPRYEKFRRGDFARDAPEWPRPWQRNLMQRREIPAEVIHLFEAVFRTISRTNTEDPDRPDTQLWKAALAAQLGARRGKSPEPIANKPPLPQPEPVPPPVPTKAIVCTRGVHTTTNTRDIYCQQCNDPHSFFGEARQCPHCAQLIPRRTEVKYCPLCSRPI